MKKLENFIGRLLRRNNEGACEDLSKPGVDEQAKDSMINPGKETAKHETKPEAGVGPTLCKDGKLYKARLRNGRWETMGAPIGEC